VARSLPEVAIEGFLVHTAPFLIFLRGPEILSWQVLKHDFGQCFFLGQTAIGISLIGPDLGAKP
jgi:hypothetical protein